MRGKPRCGARQRARAAVPGASGGRSGKHIQLTGSLGRAATPWRCAASARCKSHRRIRRACMSPQRLAAREPSCPAQALVVAARAGTGADASPRFPPSPQDKYFNCERSHPTPSAPSDWSGGGFNHIAFLDSWRAERPSNDAITNGGPQQSRWRHRHPKNGGVPGVPRWANHAPAFSSYFWRGEEQPSKDPGRARGIRGVTGYTNETVGGGGRAQRAQRRGGVAGQ